MARTQALMLQIATGDPRPISRQIADGVRRAVATGELAAGAQLPSVRGLATQLSINPNTVAKAYAELTADGWLEARQGLGLFVAAPRQRLSGPERDKRMQDAVDRLVDEVIGSITTRQALSGWVRCTPSPASEGVRCPTPSSKHRASRSAMAIGWRSIDWTSPSRAGASMPSSVPTAPASRRCSGSCSDSSAPRQAPPASWARTAGGSTPVTVAESASSTRSTRCRVVRVDAVTGCTQVGHGLQHASKP